MMVHTYKTETGWFRCDVKSRIATASFPAPTREAAWKQGIDYIKRQGLLK
jgi:hypothetical protein